MTDMFPLTDERIEAIAKETARRTFDPQYSCDGERIAREALRRARDNWQPTPDLATLIVREVMAAALNFNDHHVQQWRNGTNDKSSTATEAIPAVRKLIAERGIAG